jgi:two-component system sensor histidine kinase PilS (NtrC family)
MKSVLADSPALADSRLGPTAELAWRVIALVNLFRLLAPLLLGVLYATLSPSPIGQAHPALFVGTAAAYFGFASLSIPGIRNRWPDLTVQTAFNVGIDVLAICLLTYASGGMNSGLAALLVLPIGAASFVVGQRLALMFAAVAALALLLQ